MIWYLLFKYFPFRTKDGFIQHITLSNYTWKYYIRITLLNKTGILNNYGPDIIKNAKLHVWRPLFRWWLTAYAEATLDVERYCTTWWTYVNKLKNSAAGYNYWWSSYDNMLLASLYLCEKWWWCTYMWTANSTWHIHRSSSYAVNKHS